MTLMKYRRLRPSVPIVVRPSLYAKGERNPHMRRDGLNHIHIWQSGPAVEGRRTCWDGRIPFPIRVG